MQAQSTEQLLAGWQIGRLQPMPERIPESWELVRLTDVAILESGHTPSRRFPEYWKGNIPWISLHDTNGLDVAEIFTTAQTIGELGLANSSARLLPRGTVVFSRTATVGKCTVMGRSMATSQDFANYVCGPRIHNFYLAHLFRFLAPEWKRLRAGSTLNTIYMPVFRDLQVLLPPIEEQKKISGALNDVDAMLSALDRLIAKKRDLKQATMQRLLTGRTRLPGFSSSWEAIYVGDLFSFKNGLNKAKEFFGIGTPIVNYMDVYGSPGLYASGLQGRVLVTSNERKAFSVQKGDVFFTRTSETVDEIGLAAVMLDNCKDTVFSGFLLRGRPKNNRLCDNFKKYCFQSRSVRAQITARASYTTRALTNGRLLSAVLLELPTVEEQEAIATVLSDMDAELTALEQRREKTRLLKQGMMQELLTGRTRLI
ncbi:MAG: restriction endonuclease subunit S [Polyangia bacterium]